VSRQADGDAGTDGAAPASAAPGAGPRREVGDEASSQKHEPHVTHNDEDAPVQDSAPAPDDVAALPANAHGKDVVQAHEEVGEVDEESMYDRRPGEDKDRHETDMP
jgi:hypothetical protein